MAMCHSRARDDRTVLGYRRVDGAAPGHRRRLWLKCGWARRAGSRWSLRHSHAIRRSAGMGRRPPRNDAVQVNSCGAATSALCRCPRLGQACRSALTAAAGVDALGAHTRQGAVTGDQLLPRGRRSRRRPTRAACLPAAPVAAEADVPDA
jgi:hypothetical protein